MSLAAPTAAGQPPTDAEDLPNDVATLKRMVLELLASLHERDRNIEGMQHRIHLLLHRLYGPRGEYVDHLPLHRMERVYQRQGLFLHRSTLCDWMAACANLLRPLYDLMVSVVMQSRSLHTDDTTVKMQELVTHILSPARM